MQSDLSQTEAINCSLIFVISSTYRLYYSYLALPFMHAIMISSLSERNIFVCGVMIFYQLNILKTFKINIQIIYLKRLKSLNCKKCILNLACYSLLCNKIIVLKFDSTILVKLTNFSQNYIQKSVNYNYVNIDCKKKRIVN